jgi:D-serine dehydratase
VTFDGGGVMMDVSLALGLIMLGMALGAILTYMHFTRIVHLNADSRDDKRASLSRAKASIARNVEIVRGTFTHGL